MLRKLIILFLIFSLALFAVTELALGPVISGAVKRALVSYSGAANTTVQVDATPAMKMLLGEFDKTTVETRNIQIGGLLADSLTVSVDNLSINMSDLITKREFRPVTTKPLGLTIKIGEANLNRYVWQGVSAISDGHITLAADKTTIDGNLIVNGQKVPVKAEGKFVIASESVVAFQPSSASIGGAPLSQDQIALARDFGGLNLSIDLSKFGSPLVARDIKMQSGSLTIVVAKK